MPLNLKGIKNFSSHTKTGFGILVAILFIAVVVIAAIAMAGYFYYRPPTGHTVIGEVDNTCRVDNDCVLIDSAARYGICGGGCGAEDYSLDQFIAVNKNSFNAFIEKTSLSKEEKFRRCGPSPGMPCMGTGVVNFDYSPKCVESICKKVAKEKGDNNKETKLETLDTSTWKTYRNEKYGFEFKYPSEWTYTVLENKFGYPWVKLTIGVESFGKMLTFGCTEFIRPFDQQLRASGWQVGGSIAMVNFAGVPIDIKTPASTQGEKSTGFSEGEGPGFSVSRCVPQNICMTFFGYNFPLDAKDKAWIESLKFTKPLESWDNSECNLSKG